MKCTKFEKWISDSMDGELSAEKAEKIRIHIQKCQNCRSYKEALVKIHQETREIESYKVSVQYWEGFSSRIKEKILAAEKEKRSGTASLPGWKWAWAGATAIFILVIGLAVVNYPGQKSIETFVFSVEDSFEQLYWEINSDVKLEDIFDDEILDSVGVPAGILGESIIPGIEGFSFPWDMFLDEEITFLISEIQSESQS